MAEQTIIRNVSIALMILLMLSCCICYPECIVLGCGKLKSWMLGEGGDRKEVDTMENNGGGEGDYVEMGSSSSGKKMKKKRSKKKESGSEGVGDGLAANADVELV